MNGNVLVDCVHGIGRARVGHDGPAWLIKGWSECPQDNTPPATQQLRVQGRQRFAVWRVDHEVSGLVGGERPLASNLTVIIRP